MLRLSPAGLSICLLLLLAGCDYSGSLEAVQCDESSPCGPGASCVGNYCVSDATDPDAGPSEETDAAGEPDAGDADTAETDADTGCPALECGDAECGVVTNDCGQSLECGPCADGFCLVEELRCVECLESGDCADDASCDDNLCVCHEPVCPENACGTVVNSCGAEVECGTCDDGSCAENQCVPCDPAGVPYGAGAGSEEDPYRICDWSQWITLAATMADWSDHFILYADLQAGPVSPVGTFDDRFSGSLDGQGHSIIGLQITNGSEYTGLFGVLGGGTIINLVLEDPQVQGAGATGALAGGVGDGSVINRVQVVQSSGAHVSGTTEVGGLIGRLAFGTVTESSSEAKVTGTGNAVGGLVGRNYSTIARTFATGTITGEDSEVGGLVGDNRGNILDSYATGDVTGTNSSVGGLAGVHRRNCTDGAQRYIVDSYGYGEASGGSLVGGLIGGRVLCSQTYHNPAALIDSVFNSSSGSPDNNRGFPLTAAEFEDESNFPEAWDFEAVWILEEGTHTRPHLRWEDQ